MGIRFYCPNGHKLNVKSFLAGQRGVCPRCGAKTVIPFESTREKGSQDLPEAAEWAEKQRAAATLSVPAVGTPVAGNLNAIQPVKPVEPVAPVAVTPVAAAPAEPEIDFRPVSRDNPFASPPTPPPAAVVEKFPDPFADAPDAVWYVRTSVGDQYGPVKAAVVRQWLVERRIIADTLVWREGWEEWKTGDQVFESLAGGGGAGWKF